MKFMSREGKRMPTVDVLLEFDAAVPSSFELFEHTAVSPLEALNRTERYIADLAGLGLEITAAVPPVPMYSEEATRGFSEFVIEDMNADQTASSIVVAAQVGSKKLDELRGKTGLKVYPNPRLRFIDDGGDCAPFRPGVPAL